MKRWNVYYGINDIFFIVFTTIVTDTLAMSFSMMPTMVLFAKITPKHIEATVFALLIGCSNLSFAVLSPMVGSLLNDSFVYVTQENMENMDILVKL